MFDRRPKIRRDLAAFGYKQTLDRTLGGFSSFAAGFSYISVLTGVFQMFYWGTALGGRLSSGHGRRCFWGNPRSALFRRAGGSIPACRVGSTIRRDRFG